jgi:hypothetical protein
VTVWRGDPATALSPAGGCAGVVCAASGAAETSNAATAAGHPRHGRVWIGSYTDRPASRGGGGETAP